MGKYRYQVNTISCPDGVWTGNAVSFDTVEEAVEAAKDLFHRWLAVESWRVVHNEAGGEVVDATGP